MSRPRRRTLEFARRPTGPSLDLSGRRVLVVDDDPSSIGFISRGLSSFGFQLIEAPDGAQALSLVGQRPRPDLLIMDVEMPGLSGVDVCRIIKANQGEDGFGFIPVILMTARAGTGKVEGLELGADDYLVKPFDMLELAARVRSMLRLKALQDSLVEKNQALDRANKELDQKRRELDALSRTDSLTALHNRRHFEERLALEFARSSRYRAPLSCVLIDIDHFKRLNDTYGHPFGDRVLQAVAQAATTAMRDVDLLARYGGEELIALLPEAGPEEARAVAERLREAVEALRLPFRASEGEPCQVGCTASIGVATYPVPGIDSADALVKAADTCLYAAKRGGRNRVVQHED